MTRPPLVTVVIPVLDEAADLPRCLDGVLAQDHPPDRLEVLVVDGGSADASVAVATERLRGAPLARAEVLRDPIGSTSANLNRGLAEARGEVLCRVDARTLISAGHVARCAQVLGDRPDVAVVGGAQVAVPREPSAVALGIARALNNRWSTGLSRYRRRGASGPADTVYLGAFRTADLRAVGGWDPALATNQDFDLNRRLAERGIVWFDEALAAGYLPRASLGSLGRQYVRFGRSKARYWRRTGDRPRPRQVLLLAAPPAAAALGAVVATRGRAGRRLAVLGGLGAAVVVEVAGSDQPEAGPAGHLVGVAAVAVVSSGWWWGAVHELVARRG